MQEKKPALLCGQASMKLKHLNAAGKAVSQRNFDELFEVG